ncbi:MAG: bifunctional phosphopantothenoylcysteine decarboxylase/phosphopantothenate--cysteine ligase CoaBC [Firmicutes bacterium]|nr:bifunctional phosphopantothenoylcysteine decarboxylase/phosphopantothenate--cysteine ligase CoaBC [Dethiobacter sp.]MBS3887993.1 bifunctional phosphopantothenoylcysteine decarboxylase/phosphopantothenate--cysteine ligase CoaBC [Bacillota bacterium]
MMEKKIVVLGITGSIAAYKAADLASRLVKAGYEVDVVMTRAAQEFINPLTLQAITHRPVVTEMFTLHSEMAVEHIALADRAAVLLIAPATANIIAKLAHGFADDMLSCTALATRAPVVIAPAMNNFMYENPVTKENIADLSARGMVFVGPGEGRLACGTTGPGRLTELHEIMEAVEKVLCPRQDLVGQRIVVTAGGTEEPIDPVRFITNRSSGKMGYALASAAAARGAEVDLISAPTSLTPPRGVNLVKVRTAEEMSAAVREHTSHCDALIMAAAVADYTVKEPDQHKIKKTAGKLVLELERTRDILASLTGSFLKIGFAAESRDLLENARQKLYSKQLDLIVANDITSPHSGFDVDTNEVTLLYPNKENEPLPLMTKEKLAHIILDRIILLHRVVPALGSLVTETQR